MGFLNFFIISLLSPILILFPKKKKIAGMKEYDENGKKIPVVDRCPITYENNKVVPDLRMKVNETSQKNTFSTYEPDARSMLKWITKH